MMNLPPDSYRRGLWCRTCDRRTVITDTLAGAVVELAFCARHSPGHRIEVWQVRRSVDARGLVWDQVEMPDAATSREEIDKPI
jgi:hypothetical protein